MEENKINEIPENKEQEKQPSIEELTKQVKALTDALEKQKQAYNNASSDAASWKKQFRETQDEATRKEAERAEEIEGLRNKVAEFERQTVVATNKAAFISMGYPEDLAEKKAGFLADNDIANALSVEKEFITFHDRQIKAADVRNMTQPASGFKGNDSSITTEDFKKMSIRERSNLRSEHPELYDELQKKIKGD